MNIIWQRIDGGITVTEITPEALRLIEWATSPATLEVVSRRADITSAEDAEIIKKHDEIKSKIGLSAEDHAKILIARAEFEYANGMVVRGKPDVLDFTFCGCNMPTPPKDIFRPAWRFSGGGVIHDISHCKAIAHDRRRAARAAEFAPLDVEATIPEKSAQAEAARQAIRDKYDAIQAKIDAAQTVDEIKAALA